MKKAILVLGIARSGTSALSGTLSHLGIPFGDNLKPIDRQNKKGNFEHCTLSWAHQRILKSLNSSWSDHNPLPEGWTKKEKVLLESEIIKDILKTDFKPYPVFGIKDPRLVPLYPLYLDILKDLNIKPIIIAITREKNEVLESIQDSGYFQGSYSPELGERLYHHYMNCIDEALHDQQGLKLNYHDLLYSTSSILKKLLQFLPQDVTEIIKHHKTTSPPFLDTSLHHFQTPKI